jgi:hypothetical protein
MAVLIKFKMQYEPEPDIEGIAVNMEIAKKHAEELKKKWPHLYPHGEFIFEEYEMIME